LKLPTIGILGTGRMGRAVARILVRKGYPVYLGSRDAGRASDAAAALGAEGGTYAQAASRGEIVVIALEWETVPGALLVSAGPLRGKVVIDCTNPETTDGGLAVGHTTSGAEEIARACPGALVVKALNHIYAEVLDAGPHFGPQSVTAFLCGDDPSAKAAVTTLVGACGLQPVDAGPLQVARYLEPAAMLMVALVRRQGYPAGDVALALLRR
jgi:predicted dinucleotide-binding enzyme